MSDKLLLDIHDDGVAVLTFNRPQARNALDLETMRLFDELVTSLRSLPYLRAVIVSGAGTDAFCSGGDLVELSQYHAAEDAQMMISLMGDALLRLEQLPVPVIAAINGYALGGGSEIALACDLRFADDSARMGFVQIRLALTPGWGAGQRLLRLVGYARAMEILLRGETLRAPDLLAMGLVNRIVERGRAFDHALDFARLVAAAPSDVVRGIKRLLQAGMLEPYEDALGIERAIFPPLWADEPHLRAVEDFLNRKDSR